MTVRQTLVSRRTSSFLLDVQFDVESISPSDGADDDRQYNDTARCRCHGLEQAARRLHTLNICITNTEYNAII